MNTLETSRETTRKIISFLLLTFAFSSIVDYLVISAGTIRAAGGCTLWAPCGVPA